MRLPKSAHHFRLAWICKDVAAYCKASGDHSQTTIRCAINDALDQWSRDGWTVNHNYNQPRAIATVKRMIKAL